MQAYIIRRVLLIIPTIFVMSLIVFFAIRLIPGDVVSQMASGLGNMSEMTKEEVRKRLGLDAPIPVQYGRWVGVIRDQHGSFSGLFQGSLGLSLWSQLPVTGIVLKRLPLTFELALLTLTIAIPDSPPYRDLFRDTAEHHGRLHRAQLFYVRYRDARLLAGDAGHRLPLALVGVVSADRVYQFHEGPA